MKLENKMNDGLSISKLEEDHINILEQQLRIIALLQEMMAAQEKLII